MHSEVPQLHNTTYVYGGDRLSECLDGELGTQALMWIQYCLFLLQLVIASLQVRHRVLYFERAKMCLYICLEQVHTDQQPCSKQNGCVHDYETLTQSKYPQFPLDECHHS